MRESHRHHISRILETAPGIGPIRAALLIAIVITRHRFRSKRQFWSYCGFGVVTRSSADWIPSQGGWIKAQAIRTRGLNRNHNPALKAIFKSAAVAAICQTRADHPLRVAYERLCDSGTRPRLRDQNDRSGVGEAMSPPRPLTQAPDSRPGPSRAKTLSPIRRAIRRGCGTSLRSYAAMPMEPLLMRGKSWVMLMALALLASLACGEATRVEEGVASDHADSFHGSKTASGKKYKSGRHGRAPDPGLWHQGQGDPSRQRQIGVGSYQRSRPSCRRQDHRPLGFGCPQAGNQEGWNGQGARRDLRVRKGAGH